MTDEQLSLCKQQNHAAFELLVREFSPQVYGVSLSMMGNEHDAKDAAQEAFIKIYQSISRFRGESALQTWIYRITVNACKDILRRRNRYISLGEEDEAALFSKEDEAPGPEEMVVSAERAREVRLGIAALPTEYKICIFLRDMKGLPYAEIAMILDCPINTVKSRISRARRLLLKRLSENRKLFAGKKCLQKEEDERHEV
ncbi:MAG: sigma-70 family RNA polymerase sigma factor [Clostridia bacterium]|nr:sigma-70 family RNA polymerase sigma factor [Clostridia bacterium]